VAPVIVDEKQDEVYFTPLYYVMAHFSKFIRPEAKVMESIVDDNNLQVTAAQNPDGTIAVVVFNEEKQPKQFRLNLGDKQANVEISGQAIQTIVISN
jgi:glucosylceramidase